MDCLKAFPAFSATQFQISRTSFWNEDDSFWSKKSSSCNQGEIGLPALPGKPGGAESEEGKFGA